MKLILPIICLSLFGCTKSQIRKNGCTGDAGYTNLDSCSIGFHNIFTPNGDGINDFFPDYCDCPGSQNFQLEVKKGNKTLFETSQSSGILWDGTYKGKEVKEGVFDFTCRATVDGQFLNVNGTITLIRDVSKEVRITGACVYNFSDPIVIVP